MMRKNLIQRLKKFEKTATKDKYILNYNKKNEGVAVYYTSNG